MPPPAQERPVLVHNPAPVVPPVSKVAQEAQLPPRPQPTTLPRRLAAILYDGLLLFSAMLVCTFPLLPFTGGSAITPHNPFYRLYLLGVCFVYFGWQWTRGGHTLGMRSWRIRVERESGDRISWGQAALRFSVAIVSWLPAGLGFLWSLFDKRRRCWHDLASRTRLVTLPRGYRPGQDAEG